MTQPSSQFQTPADLEPFEVLFDYGEVNSKLPVELVQFAGAVGFPSAPAERPWTYSNFVQSLDGMVTFGGKHPEGRWIARSRHDRWMMDLLRAHADAVIYGLGSLVNETLYSGVAGGPVFRITDPHLLRLRDALGRGKQKVIVVTGSGKVNTEDYRLFSSPDVDAILVTTQQGRRQVQAGATPVVVCGERREVDLHALVRSLRADHGVRFLLCEGGPTLYSAFVHAGLMDEKFLTIAPQEIGPLVPDSDLPPGDAADPASRNRLTTMAGYGFTVEGAPWYRWLSCRKAGDHQFNRYRRQAAR